MKKETITTLAAVIVVAVIIGFVMGVIATNDSNEIILGFGDWEIVISRKQKSSVETPPTRSPLSPTEQPDAPSEEEMISPEPPSQNVSCFSARVLHPYYKDSPLSAKIFLSNFNPVEECFEKAYQFMVNVKSEKNIDGKPHFWCDQADRSVHIILGTEYVPGDWKGYPVHYPDCGEYTKIMKALAEYIWNKESTR